MKLLRDAYLNMLKNPEFAAEAKKRQLEIAPVSGERLEALAKEVVNQRDGHHPVDEESYGRVVKGLSLEARTKSQASRHRGILSKDGIRDMR